MKKILMRACKRAFMVMLALAVVVLTYPAQKVAADRYIYVHLNDPDGYTLSGQTSYWLQWDEKASSYVTLGANTYGGGGFTMPTVEGLPANKEVKEWTTNPSIGTFSHSSLKSAKIYPSKMNGTTSLYLTPVVGYKKYTVSFMSGTTTLSTQKVTYGKTASKPSAPGREGKIFIDWYQDENLQTKFDFTTKITKGTKVYAKFISDTIKFTGEDKNKSVEEEKTFTLSPEDYKNGANDSSGWKWDKAYFEGDFSSKPTFKAIKVGKSKITYENARGQKATVTVTVTAKPVVMNTEPDPIPQGEPETGGGDWLERGIMYLWLGGAVLVMGIAAVFVSLKLRERKRAQLRSNMVPVGGGSAAIAQSPNEGAVSFAALDRAVQQGVLNSKEEPTRHTNAPNFPGGSATAQGGAQPTVGKSPMGKTAVAKAAAATAGPNKQQPKGVSPQAQAAQSQTAQAQSAAIANLMADIVIQEEREKQERQKAGKTAVPTSAAGSGAGKIESTAEIVKSRDEKGTVVKANAQVPQAQIPGGVGGKKGSGPAQTGQTRRGPVIWVSEGEQRQPVAENPLPLAAGESAQGKRGNQSTQAEPGAMPQSGQQSTSGVFRAKKSPAMGADPEIQFQIGEFSLEEKPKKLRKRQKKQARIQNSIAQKAQDVQSMLNRAVATNAENQALVAPAPTGPQGVKAPERDTATVPTGQPPLQSDRGAKTGAVPSGGEHKGAAKPAALPLDKQPPAGAPAPQIKPNAPKPLQQSSNSPQQQVQPPTGQNGPAVAGGNAGENTEQKRDNDVLQDRIQSMIASRKQQEEAPAKTPQEEPQPKSHNVMKQVQNPLANSLQQLVQEEQQVVVKQQSEIEKELADKRAQDSVQTQDPVPTQEPGNPQTAPTQQQATQGNGNTFGGSRKKNKKKKKKNKKRR